MRQFIWSSGGGIGRCEAGAALVGWLVFVGYILLVFGMRSSSGRCAGRRLPAFTRGKGRARRAKESSFSALSYSRSASQSAAEAWAARYSVNSLISRISFNFKLFPRKSEVAATAVDVMVACVAWRASVSPTLPLSFLSGPLVGE